MCTCGVTTCGVTTCGVTACGAAFAGGAAFAAATGFFGGSSARASVTHGRVAAVRTSEAARLAADILTEEKCNSTSVAATPLSSQIVYCGFLIVERDWLAYTRGGILSCAFRRAFGLVRRLRNCLDGFGDHSAKVQCRTGGVGVHRRGRGRPDRARARLCVQQGNQLGVAGVDGDAHPRRPPRHRLRQPRPRRIDQALRSGALPTPP